MDDSKNYVPNDVFVYRVSLIDDTTEITIYTNPFPDLSYASDEMCALECERREQLVKEKYFTKECIEELKERLIQKIRESDNPFSISCVDTDGGYNVTADQIFNIEDQ